MLLSDFLKSLKDCSEISKLLWADIKSPKSASKSWLVRRPRLLLSKLVSKLEARSRKLGKNELRVSTASIYTSIDNFKRCVYLLGNLWVKEGGEFRRPRLLFSKLGKQSVLQKDPCL